MEIKNAEQLRAAYPEFVTSIENAAAERAQGNLQEQINSAVAAERERIKSIDEIAASVNDAALIDEAKYDKPMTAEQLAFQAMKKQAQLGNAMLGGMKADSAASNTAKVAGQPAADPEEEEAKQMQQAMINFANAGKVKA